MIIAAAEAFNARNLSPEEVAATFVLHDRYDELWETNHTVLMGPRGSGKTTLLKMLTMRALRAWRDPRAERLRAAPPFLAIYVPTDVHWQRQLRHSIEGLSTDPALNQQLSEAAVTTHIFHSVVTTMIDLVRHEFSHVLLDQPLMCSALINAWRLTGTAPILIAVKQALEARLNDLGVLLKRIAAGLVPASETANLPEWMFLDYLPAVGLACTAFDEQLREGTGRWAFCFDELELAPQWLHNRLFIDLRSVTQRFVYKLSTSPTAEGSALTEATERNDFSAIRLWPHSQNDTMPFSDELAQSLISRRLGMQASPRDLFGPSLFTGTADDEYDEASPTWASFRDLAEMDPSFRDTLAEYGIDLQNPGPLTTSQRDQVLRKAKPLAIHRLAFTKTKSGGSLTVRSRKLHDIYFGRDAIYTVCDGNPRWLISVVNNLIKRVGVDRQGCPLRIPGQKQARVLRTASDQFGALLKALPDATEVVDGRQLTLFELLKRIGDYFFRLLVTGRFTLDPVSSFLVDPETTDAHVRLLRTAVVQGAVIFVDPAEHALGPDLRGKRFRLSHLLAPAFRLPLRLYDPAPLSKILRNEVPTSFTSRPQPTLFDVQ